MGNKEKRSKDCLLIEYDISKEKDHSILIIGRSIGNGAFQIINEYLDKEAEEIYNKLIAGDSEIIK